MPRQLQPFARVRHPRAIHLQDRHVLVEEVADVEILAVRAEDRAFGKPSHFDLADLRDLLAVDLEHGDAAIAVVEPGVLRPIVPAQEHCHGDLARRADREPFWRVANDHAIDNARRVGLEVDHADRVDVPV